jgi:AraC family transcriptional regulator
LRNIAVLAVALDVVEQRLCEPLNAADLANECYLSYSGLQKLFSHVLYCSVSEYITKRRLSRASAELLTSDKTITEIAFDIQYDSPEAFTRAFRRFWGITPGEFRKSRRFSELYPKFRLADEDGGNPMTKRKPVDISDLYDELKRLGGTYALSVDIVHFSKVNSDYGHATGDIAIAEAFARIERELSDDMLLFRIAGDEFAVLTAYNSLTDAEALARRITTMNGASVKAGEHDVPLSLRIGVGKIPDRNINYQKALNLLVNAVEKARLVSEYVAIYVDE